MLKVTPITPTKEQQILWGVSGKDYTEEYVERGKTSNVGSPVFDEERKVWEELPSM